MRTTLPLRHAVWSLFALMLSACAGLNPPQLQPEAAREASQAAVWESLERVRGDAWTVLLNDGPRALDLRLTAIDSATESIDLQTFLWEFDIAGSMIMSHLLAAAERGVRVRFLIDDSLLLGKDDVLLELHRHPNFSYRVFNPYGRRSSSIVARELLNIGEFKRLDHRMHNKAMVVDGRLAIVGGRNLADEYFGLHAEYNFRDLELLVGGLVVRDISLAFDQYWNSRWSVPVERVTHLSHRHIALDRFLHVAEQNRHLHTERPPQQRENTWLELAASAHGSLAALLADEPPDADPASAESAPVQMAEALIALFDSAREEIIIASAYLIPTKELEEAVRRAVERGIEVRILTNSIRSNNHLSAHGAYRNHIGTLLAYGAGLHEVRVDARDRHIYMLPPTERKTLALHAKALVIDHDRVFIGSANLDPRSLRINTEMGLLVQSRSLNQAVRAAIDVDFDKANAWQLEIDAHGQIVWISDRETRTTIPAASPMQNLEDWFFAHLPIEQEM